MFVQARRQAILDNLQKDPRISTEELRKSLDVSASTLRRDLLELEHLGRLVRMHGGIVHPDYAHGEPTFEMRRGRAVAGKQAIARAVARDIPEGATVYLDAGTTCLEAGRCLFERTDLRLFTHSLRLATEAVAADVNLTCLGGETRATGEALVGGLTMEWLAHLRFDFALLAASGLDAQAGVSSTELSEASVKSAICKQSKRVWLLADLTKWQAPAAVDVVGWDAIEAWVVDKPPPQDAVAQLRKRGVKVRAAN